jgi:hypothetical protein
MTSLLNLYLILVGSESKFCFEDLTEKKLSNILIIFLALPLHVICGQE